MLEAHDTVVAAVSGGPDSMALLHALYLLKDTYHVSLAVAHYNHRLRTSEADREEAFVRAQAGNIGLPILVGRDDGTLLTQVGNLEEEARSKRYAFLHQAASTLGARKVAVGHTANDQVETLLLWLVRGTGRKGLAGMPAVRGIYIRPLIDLERRKVMEFLRQERIPWIEDSSNRETKLLRNRIRHLFIPLLEKELDGAAVRTMGKTMQVLRDEEVWLEDLTASAYDKLRKGSPHEGLLFSIQELRKLPVALQRRIIRQAMEEVRGSLRRISFAHIEAVLSLMERVAGHAEISLPDNVVARREYDQLTIGGVRSVTGSFSYRFETIPEQVVLPEINHCLAFKIQDRMPFVQTDSGRSALLDFDKVRMPMTIRAVRSGDRFHPLGMSGTKKVSDFYTDRKVPVEDRKRVPLVIFDSGIAWIAGYRIDERFRITEKTMKALKIVLS